MSNALLAEIFSSYSIPEGFASIAAVKPDQQTDLFLAYLELNPGTIDAVLMYVEKGRSRASPLLCTIGIWSRDVLMPVGRVEAGQYQLAIEAFTKSFAVKRFGPATEVQHSSTAALVLNVAFDGITQSKRRKAGLTLIAPRILSIAEGTLADAASQVEDLMNLLPPSGPRG